MKRFFKAASAVMFIICIALFSAVAYGTETLPDEISISEDETPNFGNIFYFEKGEQVQTAATGSRNIEYKSRIMALKVVPVKDIKINITKRRYVAPGGDVFGIKLYTKGVIVVGIDSVTCASGSVDPAVTAGLKCGDIITHINGNAATSSQQMTDAVESSDGNPLHLKVDRNGETVEVYLRPVMSVNGKYKAGLWVRDSSAGIGTITYYDDETGIFAGLGHGVCDVDTGKIMPLDNGEAVRAKVNGFYKSSAGNPGELCGSFTDVALGSLRVNHEMGVYGTLLRPSGAKVVPVALESEVKLGKAQVITTIDDSGPQYYDIEIIKIYPSTDLSARNMIIKITDPVLLEKTGGILQGMSGSPIVQDSMLVGAVTHVFVNSPDQGYAIFAERMLETMDSLKSKDLAKAS
ncbi:MAG: SpoIVB peptidase [Clostridia bacterium]|nr:SpoIVB peptidase [Clostridia bacterium]